MATPTPGSASKRPGAGGVSTPSHLNQSSPAPRSVPSPNAARHHPAGKTPVNHPTTSSSHGSKTVSSTPMVPNLSQSGNSVSPGVNALGTPGMAGVGSGLGIEGITPGALHNISTPLAFAMSRTDSEMRMNSSVTKRNEDEERRVKMRKVMKSIGRPKGRVSEEGVARLARRVGLVSDIDDEKLTQEERDRKVGNRSFSVAGDSVIVTIGLQDQVPQSVEVNGDVPDPEQAGRVLFRDLRDAIDNPLTASLDRFAQNLGYLAQMDRLKKETDTACFAAVGGIHQSLSRLYEKEHEAATQHFGAARAEMEVVCKKSGRSMMHSRGRMGLGLNYWRQNRYAAGKQIPGEPAFSNSEDTDLWTLRIGAQRSTLSQMPYIPLRVSDRWLPEQFDLPSADSVQGLNWQQPADEQGSLPKPVFYSTLEPPVVLPFAAADAILKNFNVQNIPNMQSIPTYISLLLSTTPGIHANLPSTADGFVHLRSTQQVISSPSADATPVQHQYILENAKPDFGYLLRELPFSHPKQLIELLPTLRQWVAFGTLVGQGFDVGSLKSSENGSNALPVSLESMDLDTTKSEQQAPLDVNVALSTTPQPTLNLTFRRSAQETSTVNVDVRVMSNADVVVQIYDGFDFSDEEARARAENGMAKALDICWDLGVWIEWVRAKHFA